MSDNINIEDFKGYKGFIYFDAIVDEYANKCAKLLTLYSPKRSVKRHEPYANGWEVKQISKKKRGKKASQEYEVKVWNKTNYQLTHLLENGHLIVNKKGGVGWASPRPHIDKAYQVVKTPFIRAMEKADIDLRQDIYG